MEGVLGAIFSVFTGIANWFTDTLPIIIEMFYTAEAGLTFLGALACVSLGVSIVFLLIGVISNFIHWRG